MLLVIIKYSKNFHYLAPDFEYSIVEQNEHYLQPIQINNFRNTALQRHSLIKLIRKNPQFIVDGDTMALMNEPRQTNQLKVTLFHYIIRPIQFLVTSGHITGYIFFEII